MSVNILVLGLDDLNLQTLRELPHFSRYRFHPLLSIAELLHVEEIQLPELLAKAQRQVESFAGSVDAIVGYWDFPVSSMLPILCERFGLRGPSLQAVVKCEHKYWSRLEQQQATAAYPPFALVDLDHPEAPPPELRYPMWLKPVKSVAAELAFQVDGPDEFHSVANAIREGIGRVGKPFDFVLDQLELPPEIARVGGQACLAEEALHGMQVTVEGYSLDGDVRVYGVVDSIHYPASPSFLRYQYPSMLPDSVVRRMTDIARQVVKQIRLDSTAFNIEFFWDGAHDALNLLEVNPRHSQSHARLFTAVDGVPNHECMVSLALGQRPSLPLRQGVHDIAAKWFLRRFQDGVVRRIPTPEEIAAVERDVPGTTVDIVVREGDRLAELHRQDSYSFALAHVYTGGTGEEDLISKYERCAQALPFEFDE